MPPGIFAFIVNAFAILLPRPKVQKYSLLYAMLACIIVVQGRAYERVLSAINF